jgi:hypothetical protein
MRAFNLLTTALLAASTYAAALTRRQEPTEHIVNGGFETCPDRRQFDVNFKACGWKFRNRAMFYTYDPDTPYGKNLGALYRDTPHASRGSFTQVISGLEVGAEYHLSYAYAASNPKQCTMTATLEKQVLDTLTIPAGEYSVNHEKTDSQLILVVGGDDSWQDPHTASFVPQAEGGRFTLTLVCDPSGGYWQASLDDVSLTGPY